MALDFIHSSYPPHVPPPFVIVCDDRDEMTRYAGFGSDSDYYGFGYGWGPRFHARHFESAVDAERQIQQIQSLASWAPRRARVIDIRVSAQEQR